MRSFIFSSDPRHDWLRPLAAGALLALLAFAALDWQVRQHGLHVGVVDNQDLWAFHRARASEPGTHPLVLVGSSRMLLGVDTAELARLSARPVVQLAIDGEPFVPVLADLARDEHFRGDVLVALLGAQMTLQLPKDERASAWVAHWQRHYRTGSPSGWLDRQLAQAAQSLSAWYGSELPATVLLTRLLENRATGSPVTTLTDRSRRMIMASDAARDSAYLARIRRDAPDIDGVATAATVADAERIVRAALPALPARQGAGFDAFLARMQENVSAIERRGGRVIFMEFPTDGVIRELEQARWPRHAYRDRLDAALPGRTLYASDEPRLSRYRTTDGSHLDGRDVTAFTRDLHEVLTGRGLLPPP
ncbi:MAG: hypothetical protein ACOY3X_03575 [Pseudomonadota bacterium]